MCCIWVTCNKPLMSPTLSSSPKFSLLWRQQKILALSLMWGRNCSLLPPQAKSFSWRMHLTVTSRQVQIQLWLSGAKETVQLSASYLWSLISFWELPCGFLNPAVTLGFVRNCSSCLRLIWACPTKALCSSLLKNTRMIITFYSSCPWGSWFYSLLPFPSSCSLPSFLFQAGQTSSI